MLLIGLGATGAGLYYFVRNLRRVRALSDTPPSKIRSAAQGYVEVHGRALPGAHGIVRSPLAGTDCIWFRYKVEKRERGSRSEWKTIERKESELDFGIADDTGQCVVTPLGAAVIATTRDEWYGDRQDPDRFPDDTTRWWQHLKGFRYRYTEERIHADDPIVVIGELRTSNRVAHAREAVRDRIAEWKQDMPALRQRFDENGDGEFDAREWSNVQTAARDAVMQEQLQDRTPAITTIGKPATSGRPFLISAEGEEALLSQQRRTTIGAALGFIGGLALIATWFSLRQ
jgi:hypothetical protein